MRIISGDWDIHLGRTLRIRKGGINQPARMGNTQQWGGTNADVMKDEHKRPPKGYPKDKDQYAVPEFYLFPINNEEHTRAAIGYFSHHAWKPKEHKEEAARRIMRAAKKFGIQIDKDDDVARAAKLDKAGGGFANGYW